MMIRPFAVRAMVPVSLAITGFVIVSCVGLYSFIRSDLMAAVVDHERALADTVVKSTHYSMLNADRENLYQIVMDIGGQNDVTHLRIFNKEGRITFSAAQGEVGTLVDKRAEGCVHCHQGAEPLTSLGPMEQARRSIKEKGQNVLAITVPIYNQGECSESPCHFHPPDQKVLGVLDIGLSQQTLEKVMTKVQLHMVLFAFMLVILSIVGVSALLWRNVLLPIKQLVVFCSGAVPDRKTESHLKDTPEIEALVTIIQELFMQSRGTGAPPGKPVEEKSKQGSQEKES